MFLYSGMNVNIIINNFCFKVNKSSKIVIYQSINYILSQRLFKVVMHQDNESKLPTKKKKQQQQHTTG